VLGYVRRHLHTDPGFFAPRVAVLCPCKGIEPGLERNLISLTEFERQNYEIFFILASGSDPARSIVETSRGKFPGESPRSHRGKPSNCGEKVNNLRVAVEQLPPEFEVLAFTDSDGRPQQKLAAPYGGAAGRRENRRDDHHALADSQSAAISPPRSSPPGMRRSSPC